jgi:hypothetical protein
VTIELQSVEWSRPINGAGQIAATGRYLTGGAAGQRAFLLTPVPEPAATASTAIACAALAVASLRRTRPDAPAPARDPAEQGQ